MVLFFEAKKSEEQDYILAIRHCLSHTDEQYDEAFADGLNHMLQKYPQKIEGLQKAMEMLSHTQRKTANENMITYIVFIMDDGAKSGLHRIWFILSDISFLKK